MRGLTRPALRGPGLPEALTLAGLGLAVTAWVAATLIPSGYRAVLASGVGQTVFVTGGGLGVGLILVTALLVLQAAKRRFVRWPTTGAIGLGRGIPLACSLLLVQRGLPAMGFHLTPLTTAILVIGYVEACYFAVILDGIRRRLAGQYREAAFTLGLPKHAWWRLILLPQLGRIAMPHLINFAIFTVKGSALAYLIGVRDITQVTRLVAETTNDPVAAYGFLLGSYLAVSAVLALAGQAIEHRIARQVPAHATGFRDV